MRIIAGSAGGIPLKLPRHDLRPTMDRVREAVFSALGEAVIGARVLDLFAGGGGFGIEALSRGASEVVFVDNHQNSIDAIRSNLIKSRLEGSIIKSEVFRYLNSGPPPFDLIFADPPYQKRPTDRDYIEDLMAHPALGTVAGPSSIVILERMAVNSEPKFAGWQITRARRYGGTEIIFCMKA
jgi:16S rRNA (guanine966-N2)-methyltransferase